MFGSRLRLFRLLGIPISVDASWLIVLALLTWSLATGLAPQDLPLLDRWVMGFVTAVIFFVCVVLHELGHAVIARARGIPMRGITLFLFGGVAEMGAEPPSASSEFLMAIGGPVVSAVLATAFWVATIVGTAAGWPTAVVTVLYYLAAINVLVLLFNMIPAFPLDGGRVLRSALWGITGSLRKSTRWASAIGQGFAWVLIALGVFRLIAGDFLGGLWMGLIGMFLNGAARSSYQQVIVRQALEGEPVRRFMNTEPVVVPANLDLRHWVEDYVYRYHRKMFPVATNGHLAGVIGTSAMGRFPRAEWDQHTVAEAMRDDLKAVSIPPDADALAALSKMQRSGSSRLLVTEGDHLVGIVSMKDLMRFLSTKMALETPAE